MKYLLFGCFLFASLFTRAEIMTETYILYGTVFNHNGRPLADKEFIMKQGWIQRAFKTDHLGHYKVTMSYGIAFPCRPKIMIAKGEEPGNWEITPYTRYDTIVWEGSKEINSNNLEVYSKYGYKVLPAQWYKFYMAKGRDSSSAKWFDSTDIDHFQQSLDIRLNEPTESSDSIFHQQQNYRFNDCDTLHRYCAISLATIDSVLDINNKYYAARGTDTSFQRSVALDSFMTILVRLDESLSRLLMQFELRNRQISCIPEELNVCNKFIEIKIVADKTYHLYDSINRKSKNRGYYVLKTDSAGLMKEVYYHSKYDYVNIISK